MAPDSWASVFPQFINPTPAIIGNVQFRRAMLQAIDRQEMVDTIEDGLSSVADSWMQPNQQAYQEIERQQVVRYAYDPRRAADAIEQLGYHKGPDGTYQDATGQKLSVELRASQTDLNQRVMLAVTSFWQKLGVDASSYLIPRQLASDDEFRASYPGFEVTRRSNDLRGLGNLYSSQAPQASNHFTGGNNGRYQSPELDALLDNYFVTIAPRDRTTVLGQILHHLSDQVVVLGLFYDPQPVLIGNRLRNVNAKPTPDATQAWNANEWDVAS
jgi:peptide/nickel transport system substrate-binding protein